MRRGCINKQNKIPYNKIERQTDRQRDRQTNIQKDIRTETGSKTERFPLNRPPLLRVL